MEINNNNNNKFIPLLCQTIKNIQSTIINNKNINPSKIIK
jgi:hypothetical protein